MKLLNLSVRCSMIELESGAAVVYDFSTPVAVRTTTGQWFKSLTLTQHATPVLRQLLNMHSPIGIRLEDLQYRVDRL